LITNAITLNSILTAIIVYNNSSETSSYSLADVLHPEISGNVNTKYGYNILVPRLKYLTTNYNGNIIVNSVSKNILIP
jgi:hypothetical protein